jgi:hypothetical protein
VIGRDADTGARLYCPACGSMSALPLDSPSCAVCLFNLIGTTVIEPVGRDVNRVRPLRDEDISPGGPVRPRWCGRTFG